MDGVVVKTAHSHTHTERHTELSVILYAYVCVNVKMLECIFCFSYCSQFKQQCSSSNRSRRAQFVDKCWTGWGYKGLPLSLSLSLGWWLSPPIVVAMVASDHSNDWLMEKQSIAGKWGARGRWQKEIRCEKIKEKSFIYLHIHIHSHAFVISIHFYFHFFRRKYS